MTPEQVAASYDRRSDFNAWVEHCLRDGVRGKPILDLLRPDEDDYFVLRPKHSGFFSTAPGARPGHPGAKAVVLAGVAGNNCVLFTANDAYMRDLHFAVPSGCVASNTEEDNRCALARMRKVLKADTRPSTELSVQALAQNGG
jgi:nicotinamidase-related amidase